MPKSRCLAFFGVLGVLIPPSALLANYLLVAEPKIWPPRAM